MAVVGRTGGRRGAAGLGGPGAARVGGRSSADISLFTLHPDTKAALLLLLKFLAKQHTDSFHSALGSLPGDKAQELQTILGLT